MGSVVSLSVMDANQNTPGALGGSLGGFTLGNNPTVVTMPFFENSYTPITTTGGYAMGGLSFVLLNFQTPDGQTGTIQFAAPPPTNP